MTASEHYHAIVLGAGQGGGPLAGAFARAGHRTLLIEQAHAGGTCVNVGCTPTKTMVASARVAHLARAGARYGVVTGPVQVDQSVVRARTRAIVESFRGGSERGLSAAGVEVCYGSGRFVGPRLLEVRSADGTPIRQVSAEIVIISTGLRPVWPRIDGIDAVAALDSTAIQQLDHVPPHLLILGAGYIGLEFAQMFRRLGSEVTVVDTTDRLMPREDAEISAAMLAILREDGIQFRLQHEALQLQRVGDAVRARIRHRVTGEEAQLEATHLLIATGRRPNTDAIGADLGGIALDAHGFIRTDARLATSAPGVYAIGDVKGGPAFTHIAYDDFRVLRSNLLLGGQRTIDDRPTPYTVFTDPPLGRIGYTEAQAREAGLAVRSVAMPMSHVARALEMDETRGLMKAVVEVGSGRILGASILGIEGGELATVIQMAMAGGLPYTALRDMVFSHPTFAESLNNLFAQLD